jgi:hypothetical protein
MPRQTRVMDRLAVVRSLSHTTGDHFAGAHWMLTGYHGSTAANLDPMYPSAGSIAAKVCGPRRPGLPAYVAVPFAASVGLVPGYNRGSYLGTAYDPSRPAATRTPLASRCTPALPGGVTLRARRPQGAAQSFDTLRATSIAVARSTASIVSARSVRHDLRAGSAASVRPRLGRPARVSTADTPGGRAVCWHGVGRDGRYLRHRSHGWLGRPRRDRVGDEEQIADLRSGACRLVGPERARTV